MQKIFDLLMANKEFPNYHAERRIDIFINYFVARILTAYLKTQAEFICPEFPLKKQNNNQSTKLDYLCKTEREIIFVELKTDTRSFSESQTEIYLNCNWKKCLTDLDQIIEAVEVKTHKLKYAVLDAAIKKIKTDPTSKIRVLYLSPRIPTGRFKNIKVEDIQALEELDIDIADNEKVMWDFIKKFNLSIFEIVQVSKL